MILTLANYGLLMFVFINKAVQIVMHQRSVAFIGVDIIWLYWTTFVGGETNCSTDNQKCLVCENWCFGFFCNHCVPEHKLLLSSALLQTYYFGDSSPFLPQFGSE